MKTSIFTITLLIIISTCQISFAENWFLFFKSAAELDFYIEKNSIHKTPEGTELVWQKIVPQKNAKLKPWIEATELREVDCARKKYKTLQGHRIYENKPKEIKSESAWTYFEPDDLDTAFYKTICTNQ